MKNNFKFKIYKEISEDLEIIWKNNDKENVSHIFQEIDFIKEYIKNKKNVKSFVIIFFSGKKLFVILPIEIKNFME